MISKEVEKIIDGIDVDRDVTWFDWERGEVVELFYNPDSTAGGSFVEHRISSYLIRNAHREAGDNVEKFFDIIDCECREYYHDIDNECEDIGWLAERLMSDDYHMEWKVTEECMNALVSFAFDGEEFQDKFEFICHQIDLLKKNGVNASFEFVDVGRVAVFDEDKCYLFENDMEYVWEFERTVDGILYGLERGKKTKED